MKDLEAGNLEYKTVEKFLADLMKEFEKEDNETIKIAKLKRLEQGSKIMEYFIQKFRRTTKGSDYERRSLIKEFKCSEDL